MITLLMFPASFGAPSHSPYCVKAMCLLEMAGEAWTPEYLTRPSDMPYGKLPVIRYKDKLLPDSGNLQRFLEARGADFHPGLSPARKAQARAFQRLAEESLGLGLVCERWLNDACWTVVRDEFFGDVPEAARGQVTDEIRAQVRQGLIGHGIARMSDADRLALFSEDLEAIEAMLWEGKFLFGDVATAADASVVPFLDMLSALPVETALGAMVCDNARLVEYVAAGRAAMYPRADKARAA